MGRRATRGPPPPVRPRVTRGPVLPAVLPVQPVIRDSCAALPGREPFPELVHPLIQAQERLRLRLNQRRFSSSAFSLSARNAASYR